MNSALLTGPQLRQAIDAACPSPPCYAGVACSTLAALFSALELDLFTATSEGEALAVAAQSHGAGRQPVCLLQNSGLGNLVNPYMSMSSVHGTPVLLVIGWRGMPGAPDEPQHLSMGSLTPGLLTQMGIEIEVIAQADSLLAAQIERTRRQLSAGRSVAWLVHESVLARPAASPPPAGGRATPARADVLAQILDGLPASHVLVAGTGKCARELFTLSDRPGSLYVVGAMGYAGAIGLGIARAWPRASVTVLDGDAACLMHMGCMATIGQSGASRLTHVVLDNGGNDSTGGQPSVSPGIDLCQVARACGYAEALELPDGTDVRRWALRSPGPGPVFLRIRIQMGSMSPLGRPDLHPARALERLQHHLVACHG